MADLEQRVAALESEVAALKTRIGVIDAELTRAHADIAELKTAIDLRFDATLMAIAEMTGKKQD